MDNPGRIVYKQMWTAIQFITLKIVFVSSAVLPGGWMDMRSISLLAPQSDIRGVETFTCSWPSPNFTCPSGPGWIGQVDSLGAVCLRVSTTKMNYQSARSACEKEAAQLLSILTPDRQETIQKALADQKEEFWMGLSWNSQDQVYSWPASQNVSYFHPAFRRSSESYGRYFEEYDDANQKDCAYLTGLYRREWFMENTCFAEKRFLCEKAAACADGRSGPQCDKECHCYGQVCTSALTQCQFGCQKGWMGPMCCTAKSRSDFAYYCVNSPVDGRYVLLRLDSKGVTYDIFRVVAMDNGVPYLTTSCLEVVQKDEKGGVWRIPEWTEAVDGGMNMTSCATNQTGENSFTWHIRLQEKRGIVLPLDRNFELHCDFSNADTFERTAEQVVDTKVFAASDYPESVPKEVLLASQELVILEFVDPASKTPLRQAALGSNVELRMRLNISSQVTAQGVSPFNCLATTSVETFVVSLTDRKGCPSSSSPISAMSGQEGAVASRPFELFAFPGYDDLVITCNFQLCFSSQTSLCDDRCKYLNPTTENRARRRVADNTNKKAFASIRILPDDVTRRNKEANSESRDLSLTSVAMHPLTLVSMSLSIIVISTGIFLIFIYRYRVWPSGHTSREH